MSTELKTTKFQTFTNHGINRTIGYLMLTDWQGGLLKKY